MHKVTVEYNRLLCNTLGVLGLHEKKMSRWFKPRCPVDSEAKRWIEKRLRWLAKHFSYDVFTARPVILPTDEFFPDPYDETENGVRRLLNRVCTYMNVDRRYVNLELFTDNSVPWLVNESGHYLPPSAAGTYEKRSGYVLIRLNTSELAKVEGLVGTIAHELAHFKLMGGDRVSGDAYDNELLTDLTVVFHGLGIFMGNSPRNWNSLYSNWPGTNLRRPEYMTFPMIAYVLAHAAWWRNDSKHAWRRFMSLELRACFNQALRYLLETEDSTFRPGRPA